MMKFSFRSVSAAFMIVSLLSVTGCDRNNPNSTPSPGATSDTSATGKQHEYIGGHGIHQKININSAILSELDKLEAKLGVPSLSNKIQSERPYAKIEDLVTKKVLDQAQFDRIKDIITIEEVVLVREAKDIDYMVKLGLMKGHLFVAKELLDQQKAKDAEPHIGHPVEEIYVDIKDQLPERKVKPFDKELIALQDLVKSGSKDNNKIQSEFKQSMQAVDTAIAALPESQRKSPAFVLQVINGLLDTASSEYQASIAKGKITQAIEYQDSRGFVYYADTLYQTIASDMTENNANAHKIISDNIKQLKTVFPNVIPPAAPLKSPEEVIKSIQAIHEQSQKAGSD
jgi:hypothetical protein